MLPKILASSRVRAAFSRRRPSTGALFVSMMLPLMLASATNARAQGQVIVDDQADSVARFTPSRGESLYFWYTQAACTTGGPLLTTGNPRGAAGEELLPSTISRASTSLATPRVLFSFNPSRDVGVCNPYKLF